MQRNEIKAFRQRLTRAGFTNIHISSFADDMYYVSCQSSDGDKFIYIMSIVEINNTPHLVWFDDSY